MPDYTVQDTQTGKTITFQWSGDKPPTDADMSEVFAAVRQPATPAAAPPADSPSLGRQLLNAAIETGPQNVFTRENLPMIGGAVAGAVTGGAGAIPVMLAAAGGGAVGEGARQVTSGESLDPTKIAQQGALQGVLGGVGEGINAVVGKAAPMLYQSAEKSVAQALGATKEWAKSIAGKIAPEILERGVSGSRQAMLEQAQSQVASLGPKITQAYTEAAGNGATIPGLVVRGNLQFTKEALQVPNAAGELATVPGTERVVKKLDQLDKFVEGLGENIPVDKAWQIRKVWDKIVNKAGLFGPKATATATDSADAFAYREGRKEFQRLLNDVNPDIVGLNKEFGFWKGLQDVLTETQKRTQAQSNGLLNEVAAGGGGIAGGLAAAVSGAGPTETAAAALGTRWATKQMIGLMRSPYWRTSVSAPMKNALADALASGNVQRAAALQKSIIYSLPAAARNALERMPIQSVTPALAQQDQTATQP